MPEGAPVLWLIVMPPNAAPSKRVSTEIELVGSGAKLAVTVLLLFIVSEQEPAPEQAPPHPLNEKSEAGEAVSVSVVPGVYEEAHEPPLQETEPEPLVETDRVKLAGVTVTVSLSLAVTPCRFAVILAVYEPALLYPQVKEPLEEVLPEREPPPHEWPE